MINGLQTGNMAGASVGGACIKSLAQRETVADEVMKNINLLADRAARLAVDVEDRLSKVVRQDEPYREPVDGEVRRVYPPLFEEMDGKLGMVHFSLSRIEEVLRRLEL